MRCFVPRFNFIIGSFYVRGAWEDFEFFGYFYFVLKLGECVMFSSAFLSSS